MVSSRVLFPVLVVSLLTSASALAQSKPSNKQQLRTMTQAPFTWTGFYGGINLGYNWADASAKSAGIPSTILPDPDFGELVPTDLVVPLAAQNMSRQGFIGGIQLGYNYQINQFVFGAEADFMGTNTSKTKFASVTLIDPPDPEIPDDLGGELTIGQSYSVKQNWLGTVRARAGFAAGRALIYATGGLAYGNARAAARYDVNAVDFSPEPGEEAEVNVTWSGSKTSTRAGYTLGAGVEYAITNNWLLRAEYLYYNLGNVNVISQPSAAVVQDSILGATSTKVRIDGNIARLAISYKF